MSWTTSRGVAGLLKKRWESGEILAARVSGTTLFPLELRLKRPRPRDVTDSFGEVFDWARELGEMSREVRGFGFELRREAVRNRVQGVNELPVTAVVPTEADALRLIRRQGDVERFQALADVTLARHPVLREWLAKKPLVALDHEQSWPSLLSVIDWFVAHPHSGLYPRQLDIPGVHTKFVETHRRILSELLDLVLSGDAVRNDFSGVRQFNQRYGLRVDSPLVRFRLLDPVLYLNGLSDLSLPVEQFATLQLPVRRVFITENRVNGLAFPECPHSMVVFGLGYGLESLSGVDWLRDVDVHYWGDLDTHGFGILNRLRAELPSARSFLMDRSTLEIHRKLWVQEAADKRYLGDPSGLTTDEWLLFDDLRSDRLGERIRLEQERIGFGWMQRALEQVGSEPVQPALAPNRYPSS